MAGTVAAYLSGTSIPVADHKELPVQQQFSVFAGGSSQLVEAGTVIRAVIPRRLYQNL